MLFLAGYLVVSAVSLLPALTGYPAGQVSSATLEFIHLASGVGVFLLGVYLFRTVPVRPILRLLTVTAVLAALIAIAEFTGVGTLPSLLGGLGGTAGEGRAHSFFSNSNYFAFFSAQALVMLVELVAIERRARRATAAAAAVLVAIGLVLTLSRGGYLGGAVGLFVLLALRRPRAALALAGAAVLAVLVLYPVFLAFRLEISAGAADLGAYLDQQRSEHWRELAFGAGIQMFLGAPVFGIGFGMFQFLSPAYIGFSPATYSHNQWLDLLAEQGLVGMGFMLATLTGLVVALRRSTHALRLGALAMLAAYAVESLFINSLTSVQISGPLFLVLAAALSRGPAEGPAGERSWRFE
jgi:O-antigen ligase